MLRRLALLVPTFIGATLVVFLAIRLLPGNVAEQMLAHSEPGTRGDPEAEEAFRKAIEEQYSLNESLPKQYLEWFGGVVRGDFGESIISHQGIAGELGQRLIPTTELALFAILISLVIALPIGVLAAMWPNSPIDFLARSLAILALSLPTFAVAVLFLIFAFDWFGYSPPINYHHIWDDWRSNLMLLLPPAIILGVHLSGPNMRLVRSSMLEVLRNDYIRTARAKGIPESAVMIRHALRNALLPMVTLLGLQIPLVLSGSVILERIFSIPGVGSYLLASMRVRDYPVIEAVVVITAAAVILCNFGVDQLYRRLDPRLAGT